MEIDLSHLKPPRSDGWGFLPPSQEIFNIFKEVKQIAVPYKIMEIGFNAGHSTTYLLEIFPESEIHSIGPSPKHGNQNLIRGIYGDRFKFYQMTTESLRDTGFKEKFDLGFIDGHHAIEYASLDIDYCINYLNCDYVLIDNMERNDVKKAVHQYNQQLELVKHYTYVNTWKGETKVLEMDFYHVLRNSF